MRIRPIGDKVLVKADRPAERSAGGIYYPDAARKNDRPQTGTVVAVGPGLVNEKTGERLPLQVRPGDRVLLSRMTWYFDFDDAKDQVPEFADHCLVREQDLVALVEPD